MSLENVMQSVSPTNEYCLVAAAVTISTNTTRICAVKANEK